MTISRSTPPIRLLVTLLVLVSLCGPVAARDLTPQERLSDFDQLVGILRSSYAMLEYKKQQFGIDIDALVKTYRPQVETITSDDRFYELLSAFIAEFKDGHLGLMRPSSMAARLGFTVDRVEGKAVITSINAKIVPAQVFPFRAGDELVSLDGKPVAQIVRELRPFHSNGREESAESALTRRLTVRVGWSGSVPTGMCRVEIRPFGEPETQTVVLPWVVTGKPLPGLSFNQASKQSLYPFKMDDIDPTLSLNAVAAAVARESMPAVLAPEDRQPLESEVFPACIFDSPKGPIGYIKITDFSPDDVEAALTQFRGLLKQMRFTRGLVLDLNDNPGGNIHYGFLLASMLTDRMIELPMKAERVSRQLLTRYRRGAEYAADARMKALYAYRAAEIEKAMEAGLDLTPPGYLAGVPSQAPDAEMNYTKPILVLVNDQCYSCGDLFPAVLQDNKRAVVFGTNTAGAGGSVGGFGPLSFSGAEVSVTINVTKRSSGAYIENVGVKPDITYELTQADVASGYRAYRKAYLSAIIALIP